MAAAVNGPNVNVKKPNTFWKIVSQGVGWVFKILLLLVVIAILTPGVYFAWRAGRPMELPAFGGKSYYQVVDEREHAYSMLEAAYQKAHPNKRITHNMCIASDLFTNTLAILPIGYSTVRSYFDSHYNLGGVTPKNAMDILPAWWSNYEKFLLGMYQYMPQGPVPYCRIAPPKATTK